jgi:hypothetical protein
MSSLDENSTRLRWSIDARNLAAGPGHPLPRFIHAKLYALRAIQTAESNGRAELIV